MPPVCPKPEMSNADLATIAQVVLAAIAIIISVLVSAWQSRRQARQALELQRNDYREKQRRVAGAVSSLARAGATLIYDLSPALETRDQIHEFGMSSTAPDLSELRAILEAIRAIPIYDLPSRELVSLTMITGSVLRQYDAIIQDAIRQHRQMAADDFTDFFNTLQAMKTRIASTATALEEQYELLPTAHA